MAVATATVIALGIAAAAATATTVTASQRQSDASDQQKKLLGQKEAEDAREAKIQKDKQDRLGLNSLASLEAKRKAVSGATLPGATPDQQIGVGASVATKQVIGA